MYNVQNIAFVIDIYNDIYYDVNTYSPMMLSKFCIRQVNHKTKKFFGFNVEMITGPIILKKLTKNFDTRPQSILAKDIS